MVEHCNQTDVTIRQLIRRRKICFGGNKQLKIYGKLNCKSGKRLKRNNRVFFVSEHPAIQNGYKPCGHCLKAAYQLWKNGFI
ncbi:Ada metal-binding domain-containing protein [Parasediminibacterium paludis]|uniref:Ada metal-binding domain-containing protein n=1 Tax=Parasediminibacterium paludis TaxID=908966 RepID=A0ABV8PX18_9BACT